MNNKLELKSFFPIKLNQKNSVSYYISCLLLAGWIISSLISIFFIGLSNILNGFVIFSMLIRIIIAVVCIYFYYIIFFKFNKEKKKYQYFKSFVGYGIVFTYVFYSFPRLVGEFLLNVSSQYSITNFILVLIVTIFPVVLYLMLNLNSTKLILEVYTQKDIDYEKRLKKDKALKKKEHTKLKSERSYLENLWYEWIDVILQAIIIALIIQQFFFQMYQIPSESMVPTFLIKDRVVVNKMVYGPHIPLTEWKLPSPFKPKIGDIVVFINPKADDPNSDIRYNNLFSRIFHPFVYMMTLSLVDIDKYPEDHPDFRKRGKPKERFIVKRLIGKEGEKLCIVNDKVYKKTKNSEWEKMSEIEGQKEYGQVDLFYYDNPKMETQRMTPFLRKTLDDAEKVIDKDTISDIQKELIESKEKLISKLKKININNFSSKVNSINDSYENDYKGLTSNLRAALYTSMQYNVSDLTEDEKNDNNIRLKHAIERYAFFVLKYHLNNLINYIYESDSYISFFDDQIKSDIKISETDNPYKKYMKKVNLIYKLNQVKVYNLLIDEYNKNKLDLLFNIDNDYLLSINDYETVNNLLLLFFYLNESENDLKDLDLFGLRNFQEFPEGDNNYINSKEYFMMGDNRYNSLDSRFGYYFIDTKLDEDDTTAFSKKVNVTWQPHTIKMKHVLGKAKYIYWPLNRAQRLK